MQDIETELNKIRTLNDLLKGKSNQFIVASKEEIDRELDIIRGIVPTPKGYKVNKDRIRRYMRQPS